MAISRKSLIIKFMGLIGSNTIKVLKRYSYIYNLK